MNLDLWTRNLHRDAAFDAFRERGYQLATAEHIARTAGAGRATFYQHFPSKAEVVIALLERIEPTVVDICRRLDSLLPEPSRAAVRDWVEETTRFWHRDRLRWDAMEQALAVEPKVADRWYSSLLKAVDAMATHLASGRLRGERLLRGGQSVAVWTTTRRSWSC